MLRDLSQKSVLPSRMSKVKPPASQHRAFLKMMNPELFGFYFMLGKEKLDENGHELHAGKNTVIFTSLK